MRILVTGARGMLGVALCPLLSRQHEVIEVDIEDFDIIKPSATEEVVKLDPEIVCHLAAYTDVDGAEEDPETAHLTNSTGTKNVVLGCQRLNIPVLYLSTDYVFDGEKGEPYHELDHPNPLNVYGKSKLEGERWVNHLLTDFYIVRSSWLFGRGGRNFVDRILALVEEKSALDIVADQVGSPTYAADLASALKLLMESGRHGVYHVTNSGSCSWYDFSLKILELKGIEGVRVTPTDSQSYGSPAKRPRYSVLSNLTFVDQLDYKLRPWEEALADYLSSA